MQFCSLTLRNALCLLNGSFGQFGIGDTSSRNNFLEEIDFNLITRPPNSSSQDLRSAIPVAGFLKLPGVAGDKRNPALIEENRDLTYVRKETLLLNK